MLIIDARDKDRTFTFNGAKIIVFSPSTGAIEILAKQKEGVFVVADTYSELGATTYDFGRAEFKINCTENAELTVYEV